MTAFLLDTNVVSELVRPAPDPGVLKFLAVEVDLWLSVVTLHELTYGAERVTDSVRRNRLTAWIETLKWRFKERVIAIDDTIAEKAGRARVDAAARGRALDSLDALIAATAQVRSLTLATRDVRDFDTLDIPMVDPSRQDYSTFNDPAEFVSMPSELVKSKWEKGSLRGERTLFPWDRDRLDRRSIITLNVTVNPKTGYPRRRFALYTTGMTINDYVTSVARKAEKYDNERVALEDVCWDWNHKFIELTDGPSA